jgi:anthranilate synthase component 1
MTLKSFSLKTNYKQLLADTVTPVSIYLKLRDKYIKSILLESSDYQGSENSFSYICCQPISSFKVQKKMVRITYPDGSVINKELQKKSEVVQLLSNFSKTFTSDNEHDFKFINNGIFGYMAYDAVQYFEDIDFSENENHPYQIPEIFYQVFKYVIAVDHHKNAMYIFEHLSDSKEASNLDHIIAIINNKNFPAYNFSSNGEETSNYTNEEFLELVNIGKKHCFRGDVFQIVLSRRFEANFKGDEFNVYRALRSINPSPYLFYFDYGDFKIFGSSPEAQIVIKDKRASIFPIAGTFKRTGNDSSDAIMAQKLYDDVKETSEHVMLVDLARNDLSRNSEQVEVENFKEIQYFSHVIHLVSKVSGKLSEDVSSIQLVGDTFPAGTLSGAPKHMAMNLINKYENSRRGYYGGAIGFLGFNGDFNHAIMIRSFLSKDNRLYFQAGAGIVAKSDSESELQEVNNKLAALRQAIKMAAEIN